MERGSSGRWRLDSIVQVRKAHGELMALSYTQRRLDDDDDDDDDDDTSVLKGFLCNRT